MKTPVIHRNRTFEYQGQTYQILGGGPGTPERSYGYHVAHDGRLIEDGFFRLQEVRDWLAEHAASDLPLPECAPGESRWFY